MTPDRLLVRLSTDDDVPAMATLYAWHVAHGTATFELDAPDAGEMARRRGAVLEQGWPWLVAERAGRLLGYAYAGAFRPRPAYRYCLEDSIYLVPEARGQGLGRLLLAELLARCESAGARQMLAVIGDSANAASVGVHRALGFEPVGTMRSAGWKFERWLDVVLMQKALGLGATAPPEGGAVRTSSPSEGGAVRTSSPPEGSAVRTSSPPAGSATPARSPPAGGVA